jgi:hypothetical protein
MRMNIEDAANLRRALEPLTQKMVSGGELTGDAAVSAAMQINITSIAISLKRIADCAELADERGQKWWSYGKEFFKLMQSKR